MPIDGPELARPSSETSVLTEVRELMLEAEKRSGEVLNNLDKLAIAFRMAAEIMEVGKHRAVQALRDEAKLVFEDLPAPDAWPKEITDVQTAKNVEGLFIASEYLTFNAALRASKRVPKADTGTRTFSQCGWKIVKCIEKGGRVELRNIPLTDIDTTGSSGSSIRQDFILSVLEGRDTETVFKRLPPLIVSAEASGGYLIHDGRTRTMVAHNMGIGYLRAYVLIPAEGTELNLYG